MDELKDLVDEIVKRLHDRKLAKVAEGTGISYQGLRNLVRGKTKNPSINTIVKLREYLDSNK